MKEFSNLEICDEINENIVIPNNRVNMLNNEKDDGNLKPQNLNPLKKMINEYNKDIKNQKIKKSYSLKIDNKEEYSYISSNDSLNKKKVKNEIIINNKNEFNKKNMDEKEEYIGIKNIEPNNNKNEVSYISNTNGNISEKNNDFNNDNDKLTIDDDINEEIDAKNNEKLNNIYDQSIQNNSIKIENSKINTEENQEINNSNINPILLDNKENGQLFENIRNDFDVSKSKDININNKDKKNKKINKLPEINKKLTNDYYNSENKINFYNNNNSFNKNKLDISKNINNKNEERKMTETKKEKSKLNKSIGSNDIHHNSNKRRNSHEINIKKNNSKKFMEIINNNVDNKENNMDEFENINETEKNKPIIMDKYKNSNESALTFSMRKFQPKGNDLGKITKDLNDIKNKDKKTYMKTYDQILKNKNLDITKNGKISKPSSLGSQNSIFNNSRQMTFKFGENMSNSKESSKNNKNSNNKFDDDIKSINENINGSIDSKNN